MKARIHTESKLRNWFENQTPKAVKIIYISAMLLLSFFSINFEINSIVIAILLTALYLKK